MFNSNVIEFEYTVCYIYATLLQVLTNCYSERVNEHLNSMRHPHRAGLASIKGLCMAVC